MAAVPSLTGIGLNMHIWAENERQFSFIAKPIRGQLYIGEDLPLRIYLRTDCCGSNLLRDRYGRHCYCGARMPDLRTSRLLRLPSNELFNWFLLHLEARMDPLRAAAEAFTLEKQVHAWTLLVEQGMSLTEDGKLKIALTLAQARTIAEHVNRIA